MEKQRLDNIEDMLSQLISMVGGMRTEQTAMKQEITGIKQEITGIKQEQTVMMQEITGIKQEQTVMKQEITGIKQELADSKKVNDKRHREIMNEFKILHADQDHTWKKLFKTNVILRN